MNLRLYNSLTQRKEDFAPINVEEVTMYVCGPTVYYFQHIGGFRTFSTGDFVFRTLLMNGYNVKFIMNITDVGHLTGDNEGNADTGEDRMEMAAEREGKSAKDIADYYTQDFLTSYDKLNITHPKKFTKATEYIKEQIELVKKLEQKGFAYKTSDGVYFDTAKFPQYGELSGLTAESVQEGARVEPNPEKKNPTDFALWKFSPKDKMRWQEWESPWGMGFPGWHVECSAMAMKELGETIDIHMGGQEHKMIHHQNEIAQSECATGKKFVNYWLHVAWLQVNDGKMSKSLGNVFTISDVQDKGFEPLSLRYFYMSAHYRNPLNFTWEALQNAQNTLKKLYSIVGTYNESEDSAVSLDYMERFKVAVNDDINMPKAVSVVWDLVKSDVAEASKIKTLLEMDKVLGLDIENYVGFEVPADVVNLARTRFQYRKSGIWDKADLLRRQIEDKGFVVEDTGNDFKLKRRV